MAFSFEKLDIWYKSKELVKDVYGIIDELPTSEKNSLKDQLRRSIISVPSNIAEGYGRIFPKEIVHFLSIARGSAYEVDTQLVLAEELGFFEGTDLEETFELISEVSKLISALIDKESSRE